MLNKLKQLFQTDQEEQDIPTAEVHDGLDLTLERTAHYKKSIKQDAACPSCQATLQTTYSIFMVALLNNGEVTDAFAIGDDQIGHFCPSCATVLLDMTAVQNQLTAHQHLNDLPQQFGIQVLGLLDIDEVGRAEKELSEYPIIPFHAPHLTPPTQKKKVRKPKRKR